MLHAYRPKAPSPEAEALAKKITAMLVESAVTYQIALDALEEAADQLALETVPSFIPRQSD